MSTNSIQIDRAVLLLSVQRALLGAISNSVLAICVDVTNGIEMVVFAQGELTVEEQEALDISGTEVMADFPDVTVNVKIIENVQNPSCRWCNRPVISHEHYWILDELGCYLSQLDRLKNSLLPRLALLC